jgi:hypothetical protein
MGGAQNEVLVEEELVVAAGGSVVLVEGCALSVVEVDCSGVASVVVDPAINEVVVSPPCSAVMSALSFPASVTGIAIAAATSITTTITTLHLGMPPQD